LSSPVSRYGALALLAVATLTTGAKDCGTETTSKPDTGSVPKTERTPTAHVGQAITLKGNTNRMQVTVLRVTDPLQGGQYDTPSAGKRYVSVQVELRNVGSQTYDDSPSNGARLIMSDDSQASTTILSGGDCTSDFGSKATVSPGSVEQGCIPFEAKTGTTPKRFQFGLDSGFGPQTGEWSLGP
jgi:hypothetical protein